MSDGSQCVCDITHGFYVNNSAPYSCVPCHTLCLRCYDNSYDTCNECIQATNPLVKALSGNLCECNDGYYFNTSTTTCLSNSLYIYIYIIYIYIYIECHDYCDKCKSDMNSINPVIDACECLTANSGIIDIGGFCSCNPIEYFEWTNTVPALQCDRMHYVFYLFRLLYIYIYIYLYIYIYI